MFFSEDKVLDFMRIMLKRVGSQSLKNFLFVQKQNHDEFKEMSLHKVSVTIFLIV